MTEAFSWVEPDTDSLKRILRETRSVAIVGASDKRTRPSYNVWTYLKLYSVYDLYLVNPALSEVDGARVYPSLAELPVVPDLVHVFRRYDELPPVLDETIEIGAKTIWLPDWSWHGQVARAGEAAGLQVVMDRSLQVEHTRLVRV